MQNIASIRSPEKGYIYKQKNKSECELKNRAVMEKCDNANFMHGQWLASPPPGEEVVVSGIAGQFPNSHNVGDYWENLETKTDMVDDDDRRWSLKHPEVPPRTGKVCEINRLDSGFFGIHYKLASSTDPGLRVLLEKAVEALLDAGVNPRELEGTKTAVYSSVSWSDMINDMENKISTHCSALTGYLHQFTKFFSPNFRIPG